ncbi:MAG TPA: DUF1284 domain-containing protein [Patescibacteria group bacterium]|nr:DUF1284 domain-containing protein [Patescibacteria group bacterium]
MDKEREVSLRGHHLHSFSDYVAYRDAGWGTDPIEDARSLGYGEDFVQAKQEIYAQIYDEYEQTRVSIVDGLDTQCQRNCLKKNPDVCLGPKSGGIDASAASLFGFQVGQAYPAKALINACRRRRPSAEPIP